jgi:hypothetical protein
MVIIECGIKRQEGVGDAGVNVGAAGRGQVYPQETMRRTIPAAAWKG